MTASPQRGRWWVYILALPFLFAPAAVLLTNGPGTSILGSLVVACITLTRTIGVRGAWPGLLLAGTFMYTFAAALLNALLGVRNPFSRAVLVVFVLLGGLIGVISVMLRGWNPD